MVKITRQLLLLGGLRGGQEGKVYARVWRLLGRSVCGRCVASGGSAEQE
jgi:hypothetical protein